MAATENILAEMKEQVTFFKSEDKLLEAQRIAERTNFDVEMMRETGFCSGIENYSRHLTGLAPGQPPYTLMDYFGDDFLLIIDESHKTVPQVGGMYAGDQSRKQTLVDYGFRLPSAKDNRPLSFDEFENKLDQVMLYLRHLENMNMTMSFSAQSRSSVPQGFLIRRWRCVRSKDRSMIL